MAGGHGADPWGAGTRQSPPGSPTKDGRLKPSLAKLKSKAKSHLTLTKEPVRQKPLKAFRTLLHVTTMCVTLLFVSKAPWHVAQLAAGGAAVILWFGEYARRRYAHVARQWGQMERLFGARESEHAKINGTTWYASGLFYLACALGGARDDPVAAHAAVLAVWNGAIVLGVGDPTAAWIGKNFGTLRFPNGKSIEGFGGFVLASFAAVISSYPLVDRDASEFQGEYPFCKYRAALGAAVIGGLTELVWPPESIVDDNFSIPVVAGTVASYLMYSRADDAAWTGTATDTTSVIV